MSERKKEEPTNEQLTTLVARLRRRLAREQARKNSYKEDLARLQAELSGGLVGYVIVSEGELVGKRICSMLYDDLDETKELLKRYKSGVWGVPNLTYTIASVKSARHPQ